jgi:hypothetical protein
MSQTRVSVEGVCDQADTDRARCRVLKAVEGVEEGESVSLIERVVRLVGVAVLVGEASSGGGNCPGCDRVDTMIAIGWFFLDKKES